MTALTFLQQNAEWICAIAIVMFTAVQCWLSYQQNMQNIKMKRLELAKNLDEVASNFLGKKEEAKIIRNWLIAHTSDFCALLKKKDLIAYTELSKFIFDYLNLNEISKEYEARSIYNFLSLLSELDSALINAKYGFSNNK